MFEKYNGSAEEAFKDAITNIRRWFYTEAGNPNSVVLGVSGGKDSTVVLGLLAEALGFESVIPVLIPNGRQPDIDDSYAVCKHFDVKPLVVNIWDAFEPIVLEIQHAIGKSLNQNTTLTNIPPRLRMTVLYTIAQENRGRVIGTGNKSERFVGYFTKWGDGACDFNPISEFMTDEVIEFGRIMKIEDKYLIKPPSDGLCGLSDEEKLGFTYEQVNRFIRTGTSGDSDIDTYIMKRHIMSRHKFK